jgi:hypothetical protein
MHNLRLLGWLLGANDAVIVKHVVLAKDGHTGVGAPDVSGVRSD